MVLTNIDQHVNEMMTTARKKLHNFLYSRFLIIVQNVDMVTNEKRNSRLNSTANCVFDSKFHNEV